MPRPILYVLLVLVAASLVPIGLIYRASNSPKTQPRIQVVYDMDDQYKSKTQTENPFFADGMAMRHHPDGTVAQGMLEAYSPAGVEMLDPKFVDGSSPPSWTGMDAWVAAVCYNTVEAEKLNLPVPTSWEDLTDPVYKDHLIMPNPNSPSSPGLVRFSKPMPMSVVQPSSISPRSRGARH